MVASLQVLLIVFVGGLFLLFNTKLGNIIFEKRILLKSLLYAVSLFIKTEDDIKNKETLKWKIKNTFAKGILTFDMWLLNIRTNKENKEKIYIKDKKERD